MSPFFSFIYLPFQGDRFPLFLRYNHACIQLTCVFSIVWSTVSTKLPVPSLGMRILNKLCILPSHLAYISNCNHFCSGGLFTCTTYFPTIIFTIITILAIIICQLFTSPFICILCFTCATAIVCQLPILHSLAPATHPRNMHQITWRTHPTSFHLSSDSSSDKVLAYIPRNMSDMASIESTSRKAPILTGGNVTPAVMMEFENTCHDFFEAKSVPAEKQATIILPGIKDFHICNWIAADHATIVALPFTSFMTQLHKNSLHPNWEDHVHDEILKSHLELNRESFWAWSQNVVKLNCLLKDTTSLFNDTTLCNQLDAHLDDDLKDHIKHSKSS